jgi:hypothetical protein
MITINTPLASNRVRAGASEGVDQRMVARRERANRLVHVMSRI